MRDGAPAAALADAVVAKLQLGVAPDRVRLLLEAEGAPVPLDSRKALAGQGVMEGASVVVEVLPPPAPPFVLARLSGTYLGFTKVAFAPGADAEDLKEAVCAKLKLDAAPNRVRLLLEVEGGGAPVPLDSCEKLTRQGVLEGSKVAVEVLTPETAAPLWPEGVALIQALRSAHAEPIAGSDTGATLVTLPPGALWPQLGAAPLFVRGFYEGLFEGTLSSCDPSCAAKYRKHTIIGNAGIGKSAFGAYLLMRAVQGRRTVVYASNKETKAFVLHSDGRATFFACERLQEYASDLLGQRATIFICDGLTPPIVSAFTILITSPKRERWKEFNRIEGSRRLFFPVFTSDEIADMHRSCFPELAATGVWERYRKWGGIPRYVLTMLDEGTQQELENSLYSINPDELAFALGQREIESDDAASHRLLHFVPRGQQERGPFLGARKRESYLLARSELGSPYIIDAVYRSFAQRGSDRVKTLLAQPLEGTSRLSKMYGDLFEAGARVKLLAGGEFQAFDLETREPIVLRLPPSALVFFSDTAALSAIHVGAGRPGAPVLYAPSSGTFAGVDAVLPNRALANFTINLEHTLLVRGKGSRRAEGAAPVAEALGLHGSKGEAVPFYWVLPPERFEAACRRGRPFPVVGGGASEPSIRQFALCMPFELELRGAAKD